MYDVYVSSEVAFKLPVEISAFAYHKASKRVFVAGSKCELTTYTQNKAGRRGFSVDDVTMRCTRKPVQAMQMIDGSEFMMMLSEQVNQGNVLALHSLTHPYPVKAVVPVKGVNTFSARFDKRSGHILVAVASTEIRKSRKFTILRWDGEDFTDTLSELPTPADTPSHLVWCGGCLCYALRDYYHIIPLKVTPDGKRWTGENRRLFPVGDVACIFDVPDRKLAAFARGEMLTLVPSRLDEPRGMAPITVTPLIQDVKFTEILLAAVYDAPYVVGLLTRGRVEIRSLQPPMLIQSISNLNKAVQIAPGLPGHVLVGSTYDIWLLDAHQNLRKNVSFLVQERHFDLAIQLAENSNLFTDEHKAEIKRQAATNLFNQRRFEEALTLHSEIKSNVIKVLELFPDFLPEKFRGQAASNFDFAENDKKRAMIALAGYLSAVRTGLAHDLSEFAKSRGGVKESPPSGSQTRLSGREAVERAKNELQVVDTTLLQCYLKTRPMLVDSLLRLADNACSFDDAEGMLKKETQWRSLFVLYETRRKHQLALDLLREQAALPAADPFFRGVSRTVEYLQSLGNSQMTLIFEYAKWVLAEDPESGIAIFTGDESELARNLDREAILDFLQRECVQAVIPYLEHVIYVWGDERPRLHESLLEFYAAKVKGLLQDYVHAFPDEENHIRAGQEEGELGVFRRKLIHFLQSSFSYSPNTILVQLNHYVFSEERALILGRLKKHEEALAIYTGILHDLEAAEAYCARYFNPADPIDSQVYLWLVRAFVTPSEPSLGGLPEKDLPTPAPNVKKAIQVLRKHADKMDAVAALSLIPEEGDLCEVSAALCALLQASAHEATQVCIRRAMSDGACTRMQRRLAQVSNTRVRLTNSSQCNHCEKKIGNSAFVRFPSSGELQHLYCYESISDRQPRVAI